MTNNISQENLKNIIEISDSNNIKIFRKNRDKWVFRDKRKIVKDCYRVKQQKVKDLSNNLKKISTGHIQNNKIKEINEKTLSDINSIDTIIDAFNNDSDDEYIEVYRN
jgi:hypothetical protein